MGIRFNSRNLPPLCSFALGAALVLMFGGTAWWFTAKHDQQQWQSTYGRTLAVLTAKSAIDATLNHDLVSLQVVLQDAALSRYVSLATIHDVENNLLVQAGDDPSQHLLKHQPAFSAAISFQQNVAGYVTVYLENPPATQHFQWVMLGGVFLLLLVAGLSLLDNFRQVFELVDADLDAETDDVEFYDETGEPLKNSNNDAVAINEGELANNDGVPEGAHLNGEPNMAANINTTVKNLGDNVLLQAAAIELHNNIALKAAAAVDAVAAIKAHSENQNDDVALAAEDSAIDVNDANDVNQTDAENITDDALPVHAELMVYVQDFGKFQQALSADLTAQMMQQLMVFAERAMTVYDAKWSKPPELTLNQGFLFFLLSSEHSEEEALEAAVLLAHLIKQTFKPRKIKMQLDVIVAMQNDFASLKQRPNSSFAVHLPSLAQQMALFERMNFSLLDEHWYELVNVDEAYQSLLNDQVLQITV